VSFVSLTALPDRRSNRFLVEAGWRFHYLSVERDLLGDEPPRAGERLLLVSGVAFDAEPGMNGGRVADRAPHSPSRRKPRAGARSPARP